MTGLSPEEAASALMGTGFESARTSNVQKQYPWLWNWLDQNPQAQPQLFPTGSLPPEVIPNHRDIAPFFQPGNGIRMRPADPKPQPRFMPPNQRPWGWLTPTT